MTISLNGYSSTSHAGWSAGACHVLRAVDIAAWRVRNRIPICELLRVRAGEGTQLRLRRGSWRFGCLFALFADDRSDCLQTVPLLQLNQFHTLSIAACLANVLHSRSDHLPADSDQHDFIVLGHGEGADDAAGLVVGLHSNDSLATPRLDAVFVEIGALADAVFACHQQGRV